VFFEVAKLLSWFLINKKVVMSQNADKQNIIKQAENQPLLLSTGCAHTKF
jgi:hypothetical protein